MSISNLFYQSMLSLSDDRYVHCSMSLKVADCVFAGCLLNVSLEMSVPTISSVLSLTPSTRCSHSMLAIADT